MGWSRIRHHRKKLLSVVLFAFSVGTVTFFLYMPLAAIGGTHLGLGGIFRSYTGLPYRLSFRFEVFFWSRESSLLSITVINPAFSLNVNSYFLGVVKGNDLGFTTKEDSTLQILTFNITNDSLAKAIGENTSNVITLVTEASVNSAWYSEKIIRTDSWRLTCQRVEGLCIMVY